MNSILTPKYEEEYQLPLAPLPSLKDKRKLNTPSK